MTNQEVFNRVWERAKDKRRASTHPDSGTLVSTSCKYRLTLESGEILKCFIGELIPDELYDPSMERKAIWGIFPEFPEIKSLFAECDKGMTDSLQFIHDRRHPDQWEIELRSIASVYNLTIPA
jgi:hypothetical protein